MKITFIADLHHYSKTLGTGGGAYELRSASDQKCLAETGDIIDAAFEEIAKSDTDAVFILGDITNDGEAVSHYEVLEKLYELKKHKDVYLITATHDWCCDRNARRFIGNKVYRNVGVMRSEELPGLYEDFGPKQAIASYTTKIGTICYVIELQKGLRVLCLNDDKDDNDCAGYTAECWEWIDAQLKAAKEEGCLMIGIEHHLLLPHISPFITGGSVCVANREYVASRLADAGLKYMFVGHSHIQDTATYTSPVGNTLTEVNVGCMVGYPAPMVEVTVNEDNTLTYEVKKLRQFTLGSTVVDAQQYLARHSCQIVNKLLSCRDRETFRKRLSYFGIKRKAANRLWPVLEPVLKALDTMTVLDLYRLLHGMGLMEGSLKRAAGNYRYETVEHIIDDVWLSVQDGTREKHSRESDYYKLVMAVCKIPMKLFKGNEAAMQFYEAIDYVIAGGGVDNAAATI